ncbi:MAG: hypothetical protein ABFQ62_00270 [Patescibacteria group bacterium]
MAYTFDHINQIIDVVSPQVDVDVQDLFNAIREEEQSIRGMAFPRICDATGKDDLGGGVTTGITLTLDPDWQLRFWSGSYTASIVGGNLVGGHTTDGPVAYTAGVQVKLIQSAASTLVTGGSALTTAEHDKLMTGLDTSVPAAVWEEILASHLNTGTTGKAIKDIKTKATLASLK